MNNLETTKERKNIKIGIVLSLVYFAISMIVNILFIRFINNESIAGKSQYGLYTFATSISSLLLALSFGMTSSYIRFATIAENEQGAKGLKKVNGAFVLLLSFSALLALIVGGIILFLFAKNIIPLDYSSEKRTIILTCLGFSVLNVSLNLLSYIFTLHTNFRMSFVWARLLTICVSVLTPSITALIIIRNHNIVTYVCVELIINFLAFIANGLFCCSKLKYRVKVEFTKESFSILKSILLFSSFIFLVTLVTELTTSTPKILLAFFKNPTGDKEISVAYYQLAATFIGSIAVASSAISSSYVSLINRYVSLGNNESLNNVFLDASRKMIVSYLFIFGGFVAAGHEFIKLWQGNSYENTLLIYVIACILSLINLVPSTFSLSSEIQRAKNKHKVRSFVLLSGAILSIVLSSILLALIPKIVSSNDSNYYVWQVCACAIGVVVGNIFNIVIMSIYNERVIKLNMKKYYTLLFKYMTLVSASVVLEFVIFRFIKISSINILYQFLIKGICFVFIFVLIEIIFDKKFLRAILSKNVKNNYIEEKNSYVLKGSYNQILILNGNVIFDNLLKNNYKSIFEEKNMFVLRELHEKYGCVFSLNIRFNNSYKKINKKILSEFLENKNWLLFCFGGGKYYPYEFLDSAHIESDYQKFVSFVEKYVGSKEMIDKVCSLDCVSDLTLKYLKKCKFYNIYGIYNSEIKNYSFNEETGYIYVNPGFSTILENIKEIPLSKTEYNFVSDSIFDSINNCFVNMKKNKKIAVINTYNRFSTGNLAKSIMDEAKSSGYVCKLFYGRLEDEHDVESVYFGSTKFINFLSNFFVKISGLIGHGHFLETKKLIRELQEFEPDIIHLHNIHGNYINFKLLFKYLEDKKVVFTLHDCFMVTGRCAHFSDYKMDCEEWKKGCSKCKHLRAYMGSLFLDKSGKLFKEKRKFINDCKNIKFVVLSDWQKNVFENSGINKQLVLKISNGVEQTTIRNFDHKNNEKIKLISVATVMNNSKGIKDIEFIADNLDNNKYEISVIGNCKHSNKNINYLGVLDNDATLKKIEESDIFLNPTYADTLPTTLIESLRCKTPIISYDTGGCAEIIGPCGLIVERGNKEEFLNSIINYNKKIDSAVFKKQISKFTRKNMTDKYLKIYEEMING